MNSIKDGLFGLAIGDAIGVPVEFTQRVLNEKDYLKEMKGYGSYDVPEGSWSDDTSMTIATLDSIQENTKIDYEDIMKKFVEWFKHAKYCANDYIFDIGDSTCSALLKYLYSNKKAVECGGTGEWNNGNGSLMRFLPIAEYLSYNSFLEEEEIEIIKNCSSLTHAHEISILGCTIYTMFIKSLNSGFDKNMAYLETRCFNYYDYFSTETLKKYSRILNGKIEELDRKDISSKGYIVSTLEASLWCILKSNSFEESIINAINLGGDTDTIGAITGSIAGKIYGYDCIPKRWISKLRKKEYLKELCDKFDKVIINKEEDILVK